MKSLLVFVLFLTSNYGLVKRDITDLCENFYCSKEKPVCIYNKKFRCIGKEKHWRLRFVKKYGKIEFYDVKEVFMFIGKEGWKKIEKRNSFDWNEFEGRLLKIQSRKIYVIRFFGIDDSFKRKMMTSPTKYKTSSYFTYYYSTNKVTSCSTVTIEMTSHLTSYSTVTIKMTSNLTSYISTNKVMITSSPTSHSSSYSTKVPYLTPHFKEKNISPYLYILFSFLFSIIIFIVYFFIYNCLNNRRLNRVTDIELHEIL